MSYLTIYLASAAVFAIVFVGYSVREYRARGLVGMPEWALPLVTWLFRALRFRSPDAGVPLEMLDWVGSGPAAMAPRKLRCIAINPEWAKDVETYFASAEPIVDNVSMAFGPDEAVLLGQIEGLDGFDDCPNVRGMIELPGRDDSGKTVWEWEDLPDGSWVFIPPARIHAFAAAAGADTELPSAKDLVDSVMTLDWSSFDMSSMSPPEFGGDLQLKEYRRQMRPPRLGELVRQLQTYILLATGGVLLAVVLAFIAALDSGGSAS